MRPDRRIRTGSGTARLRTFRKHHGPCGQPAAVGEIERFRPLPAQAGHLIRINAMPSALPFKSTGFAIYPLPPQVGQSFGSTPLPPQCCWPFSMTRLKPEPKIVLRYENRTKVPTAT